MSDIFGEQDLLCCTAPPRFGWMHCRLEIASPRRSFLATSRPPSESRQQHHLLKCQEQHGADKMASKNNPSSNDKLTSGRVATSQLLSSLALVVQCTSRAHEDSGVYMLWYFNANAELKE